VTGGVQHFSIENWSKAKKLQDNIPLTPGDESKFYGGNEKGYIDY